MMPGWALGGSGTWRWLLVFFTAAAGIRWHLDRLPVQIRPEQTRAEIRLSANLTARLTPGFQAVMADWHWVRTLIYIGNQGRKHGVIRMEYLPELMDMVKYTVALDPRHLEAWRLGSILQSETDPDLALLFIGEGIRQNPQEWRLLADKAFIQWRSGRYRESAQTWQLGAALPTAPKWLAPMAAVVLGQGGEIATARLILTQLAQSTDSPFVRDVCLIQLERLGRPEVGPVGGKERLNR